MTHHGLHDITGIAGALQLLVSPHNSFIVFLSRGEIGIVLCKVIPEIWGAIPADASFLDILQCSAVGKVDCIRLRESGIRRYRLGNEPEAPCCWSGSDMSFLILCLRLLSVAQLSGWVDQYCGKMFEEKRRPFVSVGTQGSLYFTNM